MSSSLTPARIASGFLALAVVAVVTVMYWQDIFPFSHSPQQAGPSGDAAAVQGSLVRDAAPKAGAVPQQPPATTTPPADFLTGAVDPYNGREQWMAFLAAAGSDGVMTAKEFAQDANRPNGFVRKCDRWSAMLEFDRNKSGTIDWPEARTYRMTLRSNALVAYDDNDDGQLTGDERQAAMDALCARQDEPTMQGEPAPATQPVPTIQSTRDIARRKFVQTYGRLLTLTPAQATGQMDTNHDGVLSAQERKEAAQQRDREMLGAYDINGDGRLSRQERFAAEMDLMKERERLTLEKYDANHNGQLDPDELAKQAQDKGPTTRP